MSLVDAVTGDKLLHVDSIGAGPDVVLLHGWGMHGTYWQGLVDALKADYRVHCIDLPGHGKSDYAGEQTLDDFVNRIRQCIESVTDDQFHLIGWSLGGLISQRLSMMLPDKVKTLALIASSASFMQREGWPNAMAASVLSGFADSLLQDYKLTLNRFLALQVRGSEQQQQGLRELKTRLFTRGEPDQTALKSSLSLLQQVDLRATLPSITQPVMLVGGERDTLVPPAAVAQTAALLPKARVHIVKGAGHAPFLSHPEEMLNLIKTFIAHE